MGKSAGFIYTTLVIVEPLRALTREILPDTEIVTIVDDSLLRDILRAGGLTPQVTKRICNYAAALEEVGANLVLLTCSSASRAADVARKVVNIPVLKIDEPMAEEAVDRGNTIGVVATLKTTLEPTVNLVEQKAQEAKKKIVVKTALYSDAFQALSSGDPQKHDRLVIEGIRNLSKEVEVVVLAQASMARLIPQLGEEVKVPVLASPRLGLERVKKVLYG